MASASSCVLLVISERICYLVGMGAWCVECLGAFHYASSRGDSLKLAISSVFPKVVKVLMTPSSFY